MSEEDYYSKIEEDNQTLPPSFSTIDSGSPTSSEEIPNITDTNAKISIPSGDLSNYPIYINNYHPFILLNSLAIENLTIFDLRFFHPLWFRWFLEVRQVLHVEWDSQTGTFKVSNMYDIVM